MIAVLLTGAPFILVLIWAVLIFAANFWMQHLIGVYSSLLREEPNDLTPLMQHTVQRYKNAWIVNNLVWGAAAGLSQLWLSGLSIVLSVIILNALMFLSITRTCVDRQLMHRVSAILIGLQLIFTACFLVFRLGYLRDASYEHVAGMVIYLLLCGYLLWVVGNRFNQMHLAVLNSSYSKLELIENLSSSQNQLHLEQKALLVANTVIQQFYSTAAHDLRQPVYAMQLYTDMLINDVSRLHILLPKISQSCVAINDMFNALFDFQKMNQDDMKLEEEEVKISEVFENLALHFEPIAQAKNLNLGFRPLKGTITIAPLYLTRILSNLITNAIRYTHSGRVLIRVRTNTMHINFEVWDTGIGIDSFNQKKIFGEFFRADSSELKNESLGLGLAIVRQLTERIKGANISVQSVPARGSVFRLSLPLGVYKPS